MNNGISVYCGLNCSIDENIVLIETAASIGLKRLFTSAIIPEAETDNLEFVTILACAIENDMEIILDVTPETISTFDFEQITLRLDDGFTALQIAALSHIHRIMLNASTVTEKLLLSLIETKANFENISALHNFYPHVYTGLDVQFFKSQNSILQSFGIPVGAFVASQDGRRRPPFEEGLPTVEVTRNMSVEYTARYLAALDTDFIIISDSLPTSEECSSLTNIAPHEAIIKARLLTDDANVINLLKQKFYSRSEQSSQVIRAANSRTLLNSMNIVIEPDNNPQPRQKGYITVDNADFGRYMGEIQIVKTNMTI